MITKFKARAFVWSISGMLLQALGIAGMVAKKKATGDMDSAFVAVLLFCIGAALLMFGLYFYTLAKNRRPAWALAGLFCLPGFLIVHYLPDNSRAPAKKKKRSR